MKYEIIFLLLFAVCFANVVNGQSSLEPYDREYYHRIQRLEVLADSFSGVHSSLRPLSGNKLLTIANDAPIELSRIDQFNLRYLKNDQFLFLPNEQRDSIRLERNRLNKGFWRDIYAYRAAMYSKVVPDVKFSFNPLINWSFGRESGNDNLLYTNTRGARIEAMIGEKVALVTELSDNQALYLSNDRERAFGKGTLPGEGYWKIYDPATQEVDYLSASGHIAVKPFDFMQASFGHGTQFLGQGFRSMVLSDHAPDYLFLRLDSRFWKIEYTNLWAQMHDYYPLNVREDLPIRDKYFAFHRLGINIGKRVNLGVFEAVPQGADSGQSTPFNPAYLNPVIFYRWLEQNEGSSDNALLGIDFSVLLPRRIMAYGQLIVDEFLLAEVQNYAAGWWGNKHAGQFGLKLFDAFGFSGLDLQGEVNIARPFVYTHNSNTRNYTHFGQPLAHPLGANFREVVGVMRLQPLERWTLTARAMFAQQGLDTGNTNVGSDLLLDNRKRTLETGEFENYGFSLLEGNITTTAMLDMTLTYMPWHNVFLDLRAIYRAQDQELASELDNLSYIGCSFRVNTALRNYLY